MTGLNTTTLCERIKAVSNSRTVPCVFKMDALCLFPSYGHFRAMSFQDVQFSEWLPPCHAYEKMDDVGSLIFTIRDYMTSRNTVHYL